MNASSDVQEKQDLGDLEVQSYGANATTYSKVDFEKEVLPKNIRVLRRNRNRKSKKVVNEALASASWQCRAWRQ